MGNDQSLISCYYDKSSADYNLGYKKYNEQTRWSGVMKVIYKKKVKDAVVIVGKYRLYFFSPKSSKAPEYHCHLFDISNIEVPTTTRVVLTIETKKKPQTVEFNETQAIDLVKAIRESLRNCTNGIDETAVLRISDNMNLTKPNPLEASGNTEYYKSSSLVEAYIAVCNRYKEEPSMNHIYYLQNISSKNIQKFDFNKVPGVCDSKSPISYDLNCAFLALGFNPMFTQIKLQEVAIQGIDKALVSFLNNNQYIKVLEVVDCSCKIDMSVIGMALIESPVQVLNFHGTNIVKSDSFAFVMEQRKYPLLKLDVSDCNISKLASLFSGIAKNDELCKNLHALDVSDNSYNEDAQQALCLLLEKMGGIGSEIEYLNIARLGVSISQVMASAKSLNLKYLNITGNRMAKLDGAMELINYYQNNTSLKQICMSEMKFEVDHIVVVLSPIANNANLQEISLDLHDNNFGVDGGIELYKIFPSFKSVRKLDLSGNQLKGKAMLRIFTFMENFNQLDTLYIGHNEMSSKELSSFFDQLKDFISKHQNLKILKINGITEKYDVSFDRFIEYMQLNTSLLALDISENHLNDQSAVCIGELMRYNNTLLALNIDNNDFTSEGILSMSYAIQNNNKIAFMEYPIKCYKRIMKSLKTTTLMIRFQEAIYKMFEKININREALGITDIHMFDIITRYPMKLKEQYLIEGRTSKVEAKQTNPFEQNEPLPEWLSCFEQLKNDPSYYYD